LLVTWRYGVLLMWRPRRSSQVPWFDHVSGLLALIKREEWSHGMAIETLMAVLLNFVEQSPEQGLQNLLFAGKGAKNERA